MKVSISWLKELVELKVSIDEVIRLLPLCTIGTKEVTEDFFELDMKGYNRADLLSMRGVAYEIAAITDSKVTFTENTDYVWLNQNLTQVAAAVENEILAPVYCLAKIEGLKVEKSSPEWIEKLHGCGMRTVNNIADVTNLVMLEYGQPLHAFDADTVAEGKIIVRTSKSGEEIITLDNKKRRLETTDLLITDSKKPLGLAGVMGGQNSEITDSTTTIILEAAIFDPINIRKTANRLGLNSEASKRFQHGLTKKRLLQSLDAAIKMYEDLGGKLTAITLIGNLEDPVKKITLREEKLNSLTGIEIKPEDVKSYLESLNFTLFTLASQGQALRGCEVIPPYFRLDVDFEEDLIEEVARMYGYEKIPPKKLQGKMPDPIDQSLFDLIYSLKKTLAELGLTELQTYSFYSTRVINNLNIEKDSLIRISNPISSETEYMRDQLWPNLLEKAADNLKKGIDNIAIFEIGKVYLSQKGESPKEEYKLSIALSDGSDETIQKLYSIIQNLTSHIGSHACRQASGKLVLQESKPDDRQEKLFHPVRFGRLKLDGQEMGIIAEVHPRVTHKFGVEKRIAAVEIKVQLLPQLRKKN